MTGLTEEPPRPRLRAEPLSPLRGPVVYLDWKPKRIDYLVEGESTPRVFFGTLSAFIDTAKDNTTIIDEPQFESFNPAEHDRIVLVLRTGLRGITMAHVPSRCSGRLAREMFPNFNPKRDDPAVPFAIRALVLRGTTLSKPRLWGVHPSTPRVEYERQRRAGGFRHRDAFAKNALAPYPPFKSLPDYVKEALGNNNGSNYDLPFVMSLLPAIAEASSARALVDRVICGHGHGRPGFYRSQFQRRAMVLARRGELGRGRTRALTPEQRAIHHAASKILRKAVVFLYHSRGQSQCDLTPSG